MNKLRIFNKFIDGGLNAALLEFAHQWRKEHDEDYPVIRRSKITTKNFHLFEMVNKRIDHSRAKTKEGLGSDPSFELNVRPFLQAMVVAYEIIRDPNLQKQDRSVWITYKGNVDKTDVFTLEICGDAGGKKIRSTSTINGLIPSGS